ncbi:MAG TPA: glycerol-3-phosphate 1-O-acyltransferase PlsY [Stellaceae bacterium]|nr:glycerol-3-phosphate 1-O-acyltransferase PlsY [Stellaceae bacterium]
MPQLLGGAAYVWPYYVGGLLAYLLGSIPFGLLLTRLAGLGDIRKIGSGNIGATNVLRTGHKGLAALTVLLDLGKGLVAVLVGGMMGPDMAIFCGFGVVLGHMFPVWLRFKGGKAVATAAGVLLALRWEIGVAAFVAWLVVAVITRYSSLAALVACVVAPAYTYWLTERIDGTEVIGLISLLVILRHHANIARLIRGEESKIQLSSKPG